jgi:hypothetical protein
MLRDAGTVLATRSGRRFGKHLHLPSLLFHLFLGVYNPFLAATGNCLRGALKIYLYYLK